MSLKDAFETFVMKGNVVDLAVAVVVGAAFAKIVTAFVDGIVMPMVTYVLPANIKWEEWVLGKFRIGAVLGATVNFLIIAWSSSSCWSSSWAIHEEGGSPGGPGDQRVPRLPGTGAPESHPGASTARASSDLTLSGMKGPGYPGPFRCETPGAPV